MIRVRIAEAVDQPRLIEFIRDHWSASHVFVDRPDVFAWQYGQADGRLNMVLAEEVDHPGRPVLGVLGFIPMGRFAPDLRDVDIMLAIWKVRDEGVPPGLGLRLLKYLQSELEPRLVAAIGTSEMVRPIYQVLRYEVGALHHSAVFHPGRASDLRIASGTQPEMFEAAAPAGAGGVRLVDFDETASGSLRGSIDRIARAGVPSKSWEYLVERYHRHPWYRYRTVAVQHGGDLVAVVVFRLVEANGSRILRIVDVIGDTDWLGDSRYVLQREVEAVDAEYVDLMQMGIDPTVLMDAGFVSPASHPGLVLPNYFAPFEARNVEIELAYREFDPGGRPVRLYRADSDQDRPNRVSELVP